MSAMKTQKTTMKTDPAKFILSSQQNFETAAAVADAWSDVRQQIVHGLLGRLEAHLKRRLRGWDFEREQVFYQDSWASFNFWKRSWNHRYGIGLMWHDYGRSITFGCYYNTDHGKRPKQDQVLNAVVKAFPKARRDQWWEARMEFTSPADWTTPQALWRLHADDALFQSVAQKLIAVAEISQPIINELVRSKR